MDRCALPEWAAERRRRQAVAGLLALVFLVAGVIVLVGAMVGVEHLLARAELAAGWRTKAAVFDRLRVAALLTQRRIRDALARTLRFKWAAEGQPQGRNEPQPPHGRVPRGWFVTQEIGPEFGGGPP